MGLISFIKEAGEKLFSRGDAREDAPAAAPAPAAPSQQDVAGLSDKAGDAIENYVRSQGLQVENLDVRFDPRSGVATVSGRVADQATREKVVLCCGNVANVSGVDDQLTVERSEPESQWYTVTGGDTLSKISKQFYGDANQYQRIFEANRPMLSHPDKIYPGQVLRIPPAS